MTEASLDQALVDLIAAHDAQVLDEVREMLGAGADPDVCNADGIPALVLALWNEDPALVRLLLEAGADPNKEWTYPKSQDVLGLVDRATRRLLPAGTCEALDAQTGMAPAEACSDPESVRLLVQYGADPLAFDAEDFPHVTGAALIPPRAITKAMFEAQSEPRPGTANPERHEPEFWIEQIRTGRSGYAGALDVLGEGRDICGPPVWSFDRFGRTATRLPDGRWVLIAGEHEDHYDPDFYIYNDVTVLDGQGGVAHYIYPAEVFPPTDFHTATLIEGHILLIGSLGYRGRRPEGVTQVLRLALADWSVTPVETSGANPGWVHGHEAVLVEDEILVSGGKLEPGYRDLDGSYALNTATWVWRRVA